MGRAIVEQSHRISNDGAHCVQNYKNVRQTCETEPILLYIVMICVWKIKIHYAFQNVRTEKRTHSNISTMSYSNEQELIYLCRSVCVCVSIFCGMFATIPRRFHFPHFC